MKRHILTVKCSEDTFNAYWYGTGEVIGSDEENVWVVDYGTDEYRANYQAGRFASGLYFATVEALESCGICNALRSELERSGGGTATHTYPDHTVTVETI